MLLPNPNWTVRGIVREILRGFKRQPVALLVALVVLPTVWYVPADVLYERLIPEDVQAFIPARPEVAASSLTSAARAVTSEADADLPRTGSGWTRPFD